MNTKKIKKVAIFTTVLVAIIIATFYTACQLCSTKYPEVGVSFSGGGFRAMFGALCCMRALIDTKLYDKTHKFGCVSGGSWFITQFFYSKHFNSSVRIDKLSDIVVSWSNKYQTNVLKEQNKKIQIDSLKCKLIKYIQIAVIHLAHDIQLPAEHWSEFVKVILKTSFDDRKNYANDIIENKEILYNTSIAKTSFSKDINDIYFRNDYDNLMFSSDDEGRKIEFKDNKLFLDDVLINVVDDNEDISGTIKKVTDSTVLLDNNSTIPNFVQKNTIPFLYCARKNNSSWLNNKLNIKHVLKKDFCKDNELPISNNEEINLLQNEDISLISSACSAAAGCMSSPSLIQQLLYKLVHFNSLEDYLCSDLTTCNLLLDLGVLFDNKIRLIDGAYTDNSGAGWILHKLQYNTDKNIVIFTFDGKEDTSIQNLFGIQEQSWPFLQINCRVFKEDYPKKWNTKTNCQYWLGKLNTVKNEFFNIKGDDEFKVLMINLTWNTAIINFDLRKNDISKDIQKDYADKVEETYDEVIVALTMFKKFIES